MSGRERRLRRHLIQRWFEPAEHEPATAFFSRLAGRNNQTSARIFADDMGFDGRNLDPADCLDAVSHLEIEGMDRLIAATPVVTARTVRLLGAEVRRRHWSEAPRVCPGCLAESAHHRTYHSLLSFTVCPFHGCQIVGGLDGPLAWWHPHLDRAPNGTCIAQPLPRLSHPLPSFEFWLLGRLGVVEPMSVPLLAAVPVATAIDAVDLLGRARLGGWRAVAPRTGCKGYARADVVRAGFEILAGGADALEHLFDDIAAQSEGRTGVGGCQWGLQHMFGWLYNAAFYSQRRPHQMEAIRVAAATVARRRGTFARSATALDGVAEPVACLHRDEVGRALGIHPRFVDAIALRLDIRPVPGGDRFVMYEAAVVPVLRDALARCLKRAEAARVLGLGTTELDALARMGLIRRLCRLGGPTVADDMYRVEDVEALLPAPDLPLLPPDAGLALALDDYAETSGLWRPEVIGLCAAGRLRPVGRIPGRVGLAALAFERPSPEVPEAPRPPAHKRGGRLRRQRARPGLTKCDAASMLGISMSTLAELMKQGYVRHLGPEASGTSRTRVDDRSLRDFAGRYAPAVAYAEALGCGRTDAVRKLRDMGVDIILKEPGEAHLMAMVRRTQVTRALGLATDPLADPPSGWTAFWSAFGRHLAANGSVFRLVRIPPGREGRLRSGDRRTVTTIDLGTDGHAVMTLETGRGPAEVARAERGGFALRDTVSWPEWFEWLETTAYLMRSSGSQATAA
ncbi:TniQ family protein [Methylorubrum thiocyanatum]|uniref:TniQ family protein n=1 Tax=Methylorubrum thiocyanatum TaxID=47958 RepID=UPI0035C8205B